MAEYNSSFTGKEIDERLAAVPGKITAPNTAAVGQGIAVEEVDENGKPTKWKIVNWPEDGKSPTITIEEQRLSVGLTTYPYYLMTVTNPDGTKQTAFWGAGMNGSDGQDGGYYVPTVSEDGTLTWEFDDGISDITGPGGDPMPSTPPTVGSVNIKGPAGRGISSLSVDANGVWTVTYTDGSAETVTPEGGASITAEAIKAALGYTPADEVAVSQLSAEKLDVSVDGTTGNIVAIRSEERVEPEFIGIRYAAVTNGQLVLSDLGDASVYARIYYKIPVKYGDKIYVKPTAYWTKDQYGYEFTTCIEGDTIITSPGFIITSGQAVVTVADEACEYGYLAIRYGSYPDYVAPADWEIVNGAYDKAFSVSVNEDATESPYSGYSVVVGENGMLRCVPPTVVELPDNIVGTSIGEKCAEFAYLMNNTDKVESFVFFTDPHLAENDNYEAQMRSYLKTLKAYYDASPTSFVVCGGDWIGNSDTQKEACFKLGFIDAQMRSNFDRYYHVIGNHDTNYQGVTVEGAEAYSGTLTNETIRNLMVRGEDNLYYSFDGTNTKFYVLDTGTDWATNMTDYRWEQIAWLAEKLKTDDAENSAILLHIGFSGENTIGTFATNALALCAAYNDATTITLNEVVYDFSECVGKVRFALCGHVHADRLENVGGIPLIATTHMRDGSVETFDLCLADYKDFVLNLVRIGTGENRTIEMFGKTWWTLFRGYNTSSINYQYPRPNRIVVGMSDGNTKTYGVASGSDDTGVAMYPIIIPDGITSVTVTCPNAQFGVNPVKINSNGTMGYLASYGWQESGTTVSFEDTAGGFTVVLRSGADENTMFGENYDGSQIKIIFS